MNKFKYFFVCAVLTAAFAGSGAALADCKEDCSGGSDCECRAEADPCDEDCGDADEAYSPAVRERAAINLVKLFLGALQDKDYAKAYRTIDGETAKDIVDHYRIYVPDLDPSVSAEAIEADFRVGGPIAARYWEWYKKDINIKAYKDLNEMTFEARSEDGESFSITSTVPGGYWTVSSDNPSGQMSVSLPRG
ncbi:hypothetical protein IJT93_12580 [bacterium]|nr:hypothetical protein [bacterium]